MIPKKSRVSSATFAHLRNPKRVSGALCSISFFPLTKNEHTRVGCVVSTTVSKSAVERNRVKRRFRDILRPYTLFPAHFVVILYAKQDAVLATYASMKKEVTSLMERVHTAGAR